MSGDGAGIIFALPIVAAGVAVAGVGLAAYGTFKVTVATVKVGVKLAEIIKDEGQKRIDNKVTKMASNLDSNLTLTMSKMQEISADVTKKIANESNASIIKMQKLLEKGDAQEYADFLNTLGNETANIHKMIDNSSVEIKTKCVDVASKNIDSFKTEYRKKTDDISDDIAKLENDIVAKNEYLRKCAEETIDELKKLVNETSDELNLKKYAEGTMIEVEGQLEAAIGFYNQGLYSSALSAAQNGRMSFQEAYYEAEIEHAQRDYAYQMAYVGAKELIEYLNSQEEFSEEALKYMNDMGLDVEEEISKDSIADYANKIKVQETDEPINEFDYLKQQIKGIQQQIEEDSLSYEDLLSMAKLLKGEYRERVLKTVNQCVLNMSNKYYRIQYACEFMEFLEDKGYECKLVWEEPDKDPNGDVILFLSTRYDIYAYKFRRNNADESPMKINVDGRLVEGNPDAKTLALYEKGLSAEFSKLKGLDTQNVKVNEIECIAGTQGRVSDEAKELKKLL